jgi:hypothetical protein
MTKASTETHNFILATSLFASVYVIINLITCKSTYRMIEKTFQKANEDNKLPYYCLSYSIPVLLTIFSYMGMYYNNMTIEGFLEVNNNPLGKIVTSVLHGIFFTSLFEVGKSYIYKPLKMVASTS